MKEINKLLKLLEDVESIELENFKIEVDSLELQLMPVIKEAQKVVEERKEKIEKEEKIEFEPPIKSYPGKINEVKLGGGKNRKEIRLGGQKALYRFEEPQPNPPVVTFDVFDIPMPGLPRPIREHFEDVMDDPGEWAKKL